MTSLNVESASLDSLVHMEPNPVSHGDRNLEAIERSLKEFGQVEALIVRRETREVIAGNGRLEVMRRLGWTEADVVMLDVDGDQARALAIVLNKTADLHQWNLQALQGLVQDLPGWDFGAYGFADYELSAGAWGNGGGVSEDGLTADEGAKTPTVPDYGAPTTEQAGSLARKWLVPPMTLLDMRAGYWRDRKALWKERLGNLSTTREGTLSDSMLARFNAGTSNFDPVLAEVAIRWFCPPSGKVLDPFGGEPTKGFVAGSMGYGYLGCELRQEQVDVNRVVCQQLAGVVYVVGNSMELPQLTAQRGFDMLLTSPPYYDLEIYTAGDKQDMSTARSYEQFLQEYLKAMTAAVSMLRPDSFVVVKVADVRAPGGPYRGLVADTIHGMMAAGLSFYNDLILLTPVGTAQLRANRSFSATRKVVRVHQNVLVFVKGDCLRAAAAVGEGPTEQELEQMVASAGMLEA